MKVRKHSGEIADFSSRKLRHSLLKSGASEKDVICVLENIERQIYDGIPTKQIYKLAGSLLKKISASHAARYNLRSAIQLLGPAGFFFEKFVARIFEHEGYQARTNLTLKGKCVSHEIDVVLKKEAIITMVECKFHSSQAACSDVKVPLYILSRFNDVKENVHRLFTNDDTINKCLIVTNNRFTTDAVVFATCSGLDLLGWDYPVQSNIKTKIDSNGLYPITCLTTMSRMEKEKLLILDVILVKELIKSPDCLSQIGISDNRQKNILAEATSLCNYF